jgi:dTDP-4-amino-4,6-dideoxygalactose transaminase
VIPVLVPSVPTIEKALPYLKRIDENRQYSNNGPLVRELEDRLSRHYAGAYVVSCSSATAGLELVYTYHMLRGARSIELPALTFCATWLAATRSGLEIIPIDVDPHTWVAPGVSGFGVPTYAPVVDAAGAFGEQQVPILRGGMTAVFSLHATKPLGAGEGGYIVTWDADQAAELRRMANFGIADGKSVGPGTNAKLSEYHAAIALAALDAWDRDPWLALFDAYDRLLPAGVVKQRRPRGVYSLLPVKVPVDAGVAVARLAAAGVEARRWYWPPMHRHPMFEKPGNRAHRRANPVRLPVTDDLADHLIGLPWHLHLTAADIERVCESLDGACISTH